MTTPEEEFTAFLAANEDAQVAMGVREASTPWAGSPFEWVMSLASRSRGKAGEELVEAWIRRLGHEVRAPRNSGHDRLVNGVPIEIKFSTLWQSGQYVFQQLRDQDYLHVMLLGISPNTASALPRHGCAPKPSRLTMPSHSTAARSAQILVGCGLLLLHHPPGWLPTVAL